MTNPTDPTAPQEPHRPAHAWVDPMPSTTQTPYVSGGQNLVTDMGSNQLPSDTHTPYASRADAHSVDPNPGPTPYRPPYGPYPAEVYPPKRRRVSSPLIVAAVVAVLAIIGTTVAATLAAINSDDGSVPVIMQQKSTALDDAVKACSQAGLLGVEVTDGGKSLIVDGQGREDPYGASIPTLDCLLGELKTPQAVIAEIQSTRALDGRQQATWGRFHGSWTYHPDDGLDIIITTS